MCRLSVPRSTLVAVSASGVRRIYVEHRGIAQCFIQAFEHEAAPRAGGVLVKHRKHLLLQ